MPAPTPDAAAERICGKTERSLKSAYSILPQGQAVTATPQGAGHGILNQGGGMGNICPAALFQVAVYARLFRRGLLYESGSICSSVKQG